MYLENFKLIYETDIKKYLEFYSYVKSKMNNPDWLGEFKEEEIKNILDNGGKIFCYYDKDTIACSVFYIRANKKTLTKHNIKYDENIVASCGPIMVNPNYIGNGLQLQMLKKLDDYCKSINKKYIFTKVNPDNIYSINNFIKDGYEFIETYKSSRGLRNVYLKKL